MLDSGVQPSDSALACITMCSLVFPLTVRRNLSLGFQKVSSASAAVPPGLLQPLLGSSIWVVLTWGLLPTLPSHVSAPALSLPLSSSSLALSLRNLLPEAHRLRKIDPNQHPPPLVTRVRPSDLLCDL